MPLALQDLATKRVHLLGIGGIGVSGVARLLARHGVAVSGCDVRESSITHALRAEGIPVAIGHDPAHVEQHDVFVYSTAVPGHNSEFRAAQGSGKTILHRSHLLGLLIAAHHGIGVTGTNGKGTVCAMITWILKTAGLDPSFFIGGLSPDLGTNAHYGEGRHMVAELDESDGSLVNIHPRLALVNNLEMDHLNYYKSFDQAVATVVEFCTRLPDGSRVFLNRDDEGCRKVAEKLPGLAPVFFGTSPEADYRFVPVAVADDCSRFKAFGRRAGDGGHEDLGEFTLKVPGAYNIENAIGSIAVATELGVAPEAIRAGLATFRGLKNRYTVVSAGGIRLVKDYMSHPTGMRKVLHTARLGEPSRLVAVFKPYRFTIIHSHPTNSGAARAAADEVIVTEMWEADEAPIPGVDTKWLVEQMRSAGLNVTYIPEMEPIVEHLARTVRTGETAVFFGGDDLFALADDLAARLGGE
jgi:UDP-N-acetylmuramate--alanine ligase